MSITSITQRMMLAFLVLLTVPAGMAGADTLKKITETGELKLGYREDAAPFSSINSQGVPEGYSIGLCKAIAAHVKSQTKLNKLKITYISVTSANRFKMLQDGKVDLLCGATTATISRRAIVDFSVPTFVTGATVMIKRDGPQNLEQMKGKNIGVLAATTTAKSLLKTLEKFSINAEVVPVTTHEDGMAKLKSGAISAYFGDRAILVTLIRRDTSKGELGIAARLFSIEPYAIALPHADSAFRQTVDEAISKVYRSKAIQKIYQKAFGAEPPSDLLKALYITSALPE